MHKLHWWFPGYQLVHLLIDSKRGLHWYHTTTSSANHQIEMSNTAAAIGISVFSLIRCFKCFQKRFILIIPLFFQWLLFQIHDYLDFYRYWRSCLWWTRHVIPLFNLLFNFKHTVHDNLLFAYRLLVFLFTLIVTIFHLFIKGFRPLRFYTKW